MNKRQWVCKWCKKDVTGIDNPNCCIIMRVFNNFTGEHEIWDVIERDLFTEITQATLKEKDRIIKIIKEVMDEGSYYRKELLKELKRGGGDE